MPYLIVVSFSVLCFIFAQRAILSLYTQSLTVTAPDFIPFPDCLFSQLPAQSNNQRTTSSWKNLSHCVGHMHPHSKLDDIPFNKRKKLKFLAQLFSAASTPWSQGAFGWFYSYHSTALGREAVVNYHKTLNTLYTLYINVYIYIMCMYIYIYIKPAKCTLWLRCWCSTEKLCQKFQFFFLIKGKGKHGDILLALLLDFSYHPNFGSLTVFASKTGQWACSHRLHFKLLLVVEMTARVQKLWQLDGIAITWSHTWEV